MNKSEIIAKLTELGIAFDPLAKVAELRALLPEGTVTSRDSVSVDVRGMVRTFSLDANGEDFEELAKQYADKFKGTIL